MIKVAGVWELGWNTPIIEFDLWNFPLRDFGVDEFIMTPISGINKKVTEFNNIQEVIDNNNDLTTVFIEEYGETDLKDFEHPQNALYVLGKAGYSPLKALNGQISVKIPTICNKGLLWPHQAICIVLNDRVSKYDSNNN